MAATATIVLSVGLLGAQNKGPSPVKLFVSDIRIAAPSRDWVAVVDVKHDLITLTRPTSGSMASTIDVRVRHVSGDNFGPSAVSTSQRQRDEARRILEARARSEGWKLVAATTDTTIGCRFLSGVRWTLAPTNVKAVDAPEVGLLYYWTPSDYRTRRRAVEVRWQSTGSRKKAGDRRPPSLFFELIESLHSTKDSTPADC